jgi:type I restriction enzyme S subunit
MVKITKSILAELPIYNPSLQEQKAIAAILSTWDEAIEKTERLIGLKEFSFQKLLSSRISSKSFKPRKLGKAIQEISQRNQAGILRVLSVTNHSGFVLPENQFERRVASQNLENYKVVCKGQYAYNPSRINVGSIARLDLWDIGVLSPMYVVFKIDETVIQSDFLYYWLQTKEARKRICASTQGSVRESVNFNDFANLIIPLPELEVQKKIIYELSLIEAELNNLSKIKEKLLLQKQGLMQKLLTGKWRVNFKEEK